MICSKIRTFVVSATTVARSSTRVSSLWFAQKFVPLWYQQQHFDRDIVLPISCDLLKNSYLCGISNNSVFVSTPQHALWFAQKFVPLWYQQQHIIKNLLLCISCDLLKNSYLCGISNNFRRCLPTHPLVVICSKIRTFVVSATTDPKDEKTQLLLWFAQKFVPLWYQQQRLAEWVQWSLCCDLLKNSYLCGISNNSKAWYDMSKFVVICSKIRTFVVSATTYHGKTGTPHPLWFAQKFVPLWYQQQRKNVI